MPAVPDLPPPLGEVIGLYRRGRFPMADSIETDQVFVCDPPVRTILPLDRFHVSRRLARTARATGLQVRINQNFEAVIDGCAAVAPDRPETWINGWIRDVFIGLHHYGYAHSVETYRDGELVGGLYGLALGAAFFGESMFSRATDASKIALVHLVARLRVGGFSLLDAQFHNDHLTQFGAVDLPRPDFQLKLRAALSQPARFGAAPDPMDGAYALQRIAQTS